MEALARWVIYPDADRDEVRNLVERLAERLGIPVPPLQEDSVWLPSHPEQIIPVLDELGPGWEINGLIRPPRQQST